MKCNNKFENYSIFAHYFGNNYVIERIIPGVYAVYRGEKQAENFIVGGSKEYIDGWLYGATQVKNGTLA